MKAIIFDWSGTLNDNFHCVCKVCEWMFKDLGAEPITEEEIRLNLTVPYMKFWNKYFPDLSKEKQCVMYERYIHQAGESKPYENTQELIEFLISQKYKLFIVSSDPLSKLIPEIKKFGLFDSFEKIIGNLHEKAETLLSLKKEYNLDENSTFYIGDTSGDVEAGKSAGMKTIAVSHGFQDKTILEKSNPDFLANNLFEIIEIIKKQNFLNSNF